MYLIFVLKFWEPLVDEIPRSGKGNAEQFKFYIEWVLGEQFFWAFVFFSVLQNKSLICFDLKDRQARAAHTFSQTRAAAVGVEEDDSDVKNKQRAQWISRQ